MNHDTAHALHHALEDLGIENHLKGIYEPVKIVITGCTEKSIEMIESLTHDKKEE